MSHNAQKILDCKYCNHQCFKMEPANVTKCISASRYYKRNKLSLCYTTSPLSYCTCSFPMHYTSEAHGGAPNICTLPQLPSSVIRAIRTYHTKLSVERNDGMVSTVVRTALNTIENDTNTF